MAHSFLIYDFGSNEETAQQARHKLEGWKQAFRLGNKILLKFERQGEAASAAADAGDDEESEARSKEKHGRARKGVAAKSAGKNKSAEKKEDAPSNDRIRMLIRLDFSDHEKLSHNRWLDQIPAGEPFKSASGEIVRSGDPEFQKTSELFDSLD